MCEEIILNNEIIKVFKKQSKTVFIDLKNGFLIEF